jgi:hypothetical protein
MNSLGWQFNAWSDAAVHLRFVNSAFHFVLGYQTVNFRMCYTFKLGTVVFLCVHILDIFYRMYPTYLLHNKFSLVLAWSPVKSLRLDFQRYRADNGIRRLISGDTEQKMSSDV